MIRLVAWVTCVVFATAGVVRVAHAAELRDARVWTDATRTRAVLDLSGTVAYKLFQLSNPDRIVVDIDHGRVADGFASPGDSGVLKDIRTGRHGDGVRVVMDLTNAVQPRSFLLKPTGDHGYRLVVDLYPAGGSSNSMAGTDGTGSAGRKATLQAAKLLESARKVVVAVDPGHGGKDPGATGPDGVHEKNITLSIGRRLAKLIDQQPGMTAIMTRTGDYYVGLKERREIARKHHADVFVSIHADAYRDADASGSSVWVLSTHGKVSEAARWLANTQNHDGLLGGVSLDDKSEALAHVLLDLQQSYAIGASKRIANNVLHSLARLGPTHRDHIERANFVVLRSPDIPSILVETAFITNPVGERKLQNGAYQEKIAEAILSGVKTYFTNTPPPGTWFALQARKRRGELASAGAISYKVGRGDTLSGIAQQYGVSVDALKAANHMDSDLVRVGAVLSIPTS